MKEVRKVYETADLEALINQIDEVQLPVSALSDHVTNGEPWAAHWLGGDLETGATEVQPPRIAEARRLLHEASKLLLRASYHVAMHTAGSEEVD